MRQRFVYIAAFIIIVGLAWIPAHAASLFEDYANRSKTDLETETDKMASELKDTFNEKSINQYQQKIDFADYFANLKKLVLYGAKMGNYGSYEQDLAFAKDNEIFKGLPDSQRGAATDRKEYIGQKFDRMKQNVEEEVATYEDLIRISLDACEIMASNDLSGFMENEDNVETIREFVEGSESYRQFSQRYGSMQAKWPDLASRIMLQVEKWQAPPRNMDDPLIDRAITGAL